MFVTQIDAMFGLLEHTKQKQLWGITLESQIKRRMFQLHARHSVGVEKIACEIYSNSNVFGSKRTPHILLHNTEDLRTIVKSEPLKYPGSSSGKFRKLIHDSSPRFRGRTAMKRSCLIESLHSWNPS